MNIHEAARQAGTTVRTLRYYEEIGLIEPVREENGYRDFDEAAVQRIKLIRAYRELHFSLEETGKLLEASRAERNEMLEKQIEALKNKRQIIENRIELAQFIRAYGPERLTTIDFRSVDTDMEKARQNLKEDQEMQQFYERMKGKSDEDMETAVQETLSCFAAIILAPDYLLNNAVEMLKSCVERHFYPCTNDILKGYACSFGGDGHIAQILEDRIAPDAPKILRSKLEHWLKQNESLCAAATTAAAQKL